MNIELFCREAWLFRTGKSCFGKNYKYPRILLTLKRGKFGNFVEYWKMAGDPRFPVTYRFAVGFLGTYFSFCIGR
jgi:hypothetical protein